MPRLPANFGKTTNARANKSKETDPDGGYGSSSSSEDDDDGDGGYTVVGEDVSDDSEDDAADADEVKKTGSAKKNDCVERKRTMERPKVWRPSVNKEEEEEINFEEMEYDRQAYDCLHAFRLEWPSLSFDLMRDDAGENRARFPHQFFMVSGTQADQANKNSLSVSRVGRLKRTGGNTTTTTTKNKKNRNDSSNNDNDSEDDSDDDADDDDDDSESESDDEEFDAANPAKSGKPTLHVSSISHPGGINRVRLMPQNTSICCTWSDTGHVLCWDITQAFRTLQHSIEDQKNQTEPNIVNEKKLKLAPKKVHSKHREEGYAIDWSSISAGSLASGDNAGAVHIWQPTDENCSDWKIDCDYTDGHDHKSVEDIQWSPSEPTVFASCGGDGCVAVWDTRQKPKPAIRVRASEQSDINVMSWNRLANCMIATGADDGALKIWDLRHFDAKQAQTTTTTNANANANHGPKPVAQFQFHRGHISSVDWSPFDSAMLLSAASDNTLCIWDLAVERDAEEEAQAMLENDSNAEIPEDLPPQLMFVHQGIQDPKEARFHAQIPGLVVSTALDGFHCFKPFNVGFEI